MTFNPEICNVKSVNEFEDGYIIYLDNSLIFDLNKKYGVKPKEGDEIQMRGGIGETIKGYEQ